MGRKEKIVVGLDVGSTKVCTLIGALRDTGLEPLGFSAVESRGMKKGAVTNLEAIVDSIRRSVAEAETASRCDVDRVYVGLAGPHVRSSNSRGAVPVSTRPREIVADDVKRAIETARAVALAPDREIIHIIPQEFTVDEQTGIADPLGITGTRLEVNVHIVTSSTTAAQTMVTAVNRSGLLVEDTVLDSIAAGEAVLSEDERELGTVLVDIGGGKTSVAIYHHGAVRHTVVLPIGGEHFSSDIAVGLRTTIPEAERVKREQGCAVSSVSDRDSMFEIAGVGSRQPRAIAQQVLTDILQPRAEEILHFVRNEVRAAGYERQTGAGVVLTGGGAMLKGFVELAEDVLNLPVRIGIASRSFESRDAHVSALQGPEFAAVTGLVSYAERRRRRHDFHENSGSGLRRLVSRLRGLI